MQRSIQTLKQALVFGAFTLVLAPALTYAQEEGAIPAPPDLTPDLTTDLTTVAERLTPADIARLDEEPTGLSVDGMDRAMVTYFRGERLGGVGFASVGASSLIAGGLMLGSSSDFWKGMSYPLLGLGGIQFLVGSVTLFSPTLRMRRFKKQMRADASGYRATEGKRMRGVRLTFKLLFITEIVVAAAGAGMAIYGSRTDRDVLAGIGAGLSAQALLLLLQDSLAARRAGRYLDALNDFRVAIAPEQKSYWLSYGRTF